RPVSNRWHAPDRGSLLSAAPPTAAWLNPPPTTEAASVRSCETCLKSLARTGPRVVVARRRAGVRSARDGGGGGGAAGLDDGGGGGAEAGGDRDAVAGGELVEVPEADGAVAVEGGEGPAVLRQRDGVDAGV